MLVSLQTNTCKHYSSLVLVFARGVTTWSRRSDSVWNPSTPGPVRRVSRTKKRGFIISFRRIRRVPSVPVFCDWEDRFHTWRRSLWSRNSPHTCVTLYPEKDTLKSRSCLFTVSKTVGPRPSSLTPNQTTGIESLLGYKTRQPSSFFSMSCVTHSRPVPVNVNLGLVDV